MCSRLDSFDSRMSRTVFATFPASVWRTLVSVFVVGLLLGIFFVLSGCGAGGSNGTDERPGDTTPPNAPLGLSGTSGDTEVTLHWNTVTASDLQAYRVYRATSTSIEDISSRNPVSSLSDTSFTDTGLTNGTEYSYVVTAVDDAGNESTPSDAVEKIPAASDSAPSAPTGLTGTSGDTEITLNWDEVTAGDLQHYNVYRGTSSSVTEIDGQDPVSTSSTESFTDTGLTNGTKYYYAVTAVDDSGNESGPSTLLEKTPFPDPPARP